MPAPTTAAFTTEFGQEFEHERGQWLRRRFLRYAGTVVVLNVLMSVLPGIGTFLVWPFQGPPPEGLPPVLLELGAGLIVTGLYAWAWKRVRSEAHAGPEVLRLVVWLIITSGVLPLAVGLVTLKVFRQPDIRIGDAEIGVGLAWVGNVFITHLFACLFLPWTPRECFRPLWPLLALNALLEIASGDGTAQKALIIAASPVIGMPGALICWYRHSRFRERFTLNTLRGRYSEMKRELVDARRLHEDLFPEPIHDGPVRLRYRYEPMRQIGGDYLYASLGPSAAGGARALNIVVLDVTGHGIAAALTVNRLHGELDRLLAEQPDMRPGEVLRLLNRYVHLTLATHSVYVTALCVRADPDAGTLEYASGGHPPAFLRAVDGTIEQMDSTGFVLGACAGADYDPAPRTLPFGPGDVLIAYTDGATEARDVRGRMVGIAGIQRAILAGPLGYGDTPDWTAAILDAVDAHRHGPPADDTLIIEVSRPLEPAALTPRPAPLHAR
ncbi:MAG: serine/threonine-protein phosphatase [Phycisphaerales bacterium]|nr:serine/threonine-protein phosphatase [Phycisphaerales bacterium]